MILFKNIPSTLFVLLFCLQSCSQDKIVEKTNFENKTIMNIDQYIFPEAKDVTEDNFVEKVNAQIKHYNTEPVYYFRTNKQNCLIEIYVNDVSIFDDYEISNYITLTPFSSVFLKSGTQKITVKMYPVGNLNNESLGVKNAQPMTELTDDSKVAISVISIDEKSNKKLDDEILIIEKTSPKEAAGKEYYEFTFAFNAKVPYEFEGWSKGQDLKKLDQGLVRKKAIEFYKMVGEIYANKDLNSRLKLDYPSTVRIKNSYFRDKQSIEETLSEYRDDLTKYDYTIEPFKDFKMEYMGNNKLLRLITNSKDPDLRNGGALFLKYGEDGISVPGITLFLPEGRDLATQGFMMWK